VFKTAFPPPFGNNKCFHLTCSAIQGCDSSLQVNRKLKPRSITALQVWWLAYKSSPSSVAFNVL
jgi:hypothetical protein